MTRSHVAVSEDSQNRLRTANKKAWVKSEWMDRSEVGWRRAERRRFGVPR